MSSRLGSLKAEIGNADKSFAGKVFNPFLTHAHNLCSSFLSRRGWIISGKGLGWCDSYSLFTPPSLLSELFMAFRQDPHNVVHASHYCCSFMTRHYSHCPQLGEIVEDERLFPYNSFNEEQTTETHQVVGWNVGGRHSFREALKCLYY